MLRRDFLSGSMRAIATGATSVPLSFSAVKSILEYGAKPDGVTLSTSAVQRTIDDVANSGGGVVYVPPGTFLIGGVELKTAVTLYLEAGCVLLGSTSIGDYDAHPGPKQGSGTNAYHLLFAKDAHDVSICGKGVIDGQGESYWQPKSRRSQSTPVDPWRDIVSQDYEARDDNHRPSPMIEFVRCQNISICGVTLKNAPSWTLRPIGCETVLIDGVRIRNPKIGVNTDGMDVTCSQNVMISNCDIVTGDDAICLKSENPYGDVGSTKNVTITNCVINGGNGLKLGTASHGAFENIVFSNSVIYTDPEGPLNARTVGGINLEVVDGGSADGIVVSNIRMQYVRAPIFIRLGQRQKRADTFLRNVLIENVDAIGAVNASSITGVPDLRPSDITISNCRIRTVEQGLADWNRRGIPEVPDKYPEAWMMGRLPAYGFFIRHTDRVRLRNVECIADKPDGRPAIVCSDLSGLVLAGLDLTPPSGNAPLVQLSDVRVAFITGMHMPLGSKAFAEISGATSAGISFAGNALGKVGEAVVFSDGATSKALEENTFS